MQVGKIIFGLMLVMVCVSFVSAQSIEHTASTDTICDGGVCTKTLYSGVRNVYEDNQWKPIEKARSLKNKGFNIITLEDDKDFPVEVVDFNYTSITVNLNPKGIKIFNQDIPLRIWEQDSEKEQQFYDDVKDGKKISKGIDDYKEKMNKVIEENIKFNLLNQEEEKTYDFGMGKILEFGFNSTTIILQDADTENFGDSWLDEGFPDTVRGDSDDLRIGDISDSRNWIIIKFNMSSIPSSVLIYNATLNLYLYYNALDGGDSVIMNIHNVLNSTWSEEVITWNTIPSYNITNESTFTINGGDDDLWNNWSVLDSVNREYLNFNDSINFLIDYFNESGDISNNYWHYYSKEYTTTSLRPYLNIIYSLLDTTPPTITSLTETPTDPASSGLTYEFNATITDETAVDKVYLEFDGTNYTATNLSADVYNVTLTGITEGTYDYNWFANDTLGYVNNTESGTYTIQSSGYLISNYKLNENSGTTLYDIVGSDNGANTGATWNNDGIELTLTEDTDYTRTGTTFTIINSVYSWWEIVGTWSYWDIVRSEGYTLNTNYMNTQLGSTGLAGWIPAIIALMIGMVFLGIFLARSNRKL